MRNFYMDLVYFFYPKNFKIKNIFKIEDRVLTEADHVPDGTRRVTRYLLGGKVHTHLGTSWPPRGHTMRMPITRAWVEPSGRDVTADMKRLDGPSWLVGSAWTPMWPVITVAWGFNSTGFSFKIKIFKKFFLKEEGVVRVAFSPPVAPGRT